MGSSLDDRGPPHKGAPSTPAAVAGAILAEPEDVLRGRALAWIADDPDEGSRVELREILQRDDTEELRVRMGEPLSFGTSGIRGRLGAGSALINPATVRRMSAGLLAYLGASRGPGVPGVTSTGDGRQERPRVIVGRDARRGSERLAGEVAAVLSGGDVSVLRLPRPLPTPVLAFAVRELGAVAGVMVTASHNPRGENGCKIYLGDGAQIMPPVDELVARAMGRVGSLREVPVGDGGEALGEEIVEAYVEAVVASTPGARRTADGAPAAPESRGMQGRQQPDAGAGLRILYTPLHGVGRDVLLECFARAGRPAPAVLASQGDPDADFPTTPRPNPEELSALAPALQRARETEADLLLANDPDADRLAAAVPDGQGGWRLLSGDEIGSLLADHVLRHTPPGERKGMLMVSTVASSTLLDEMAREAGVLHVRTLTGFKWIMRAVDHVAGAERLLFGYEEALGYAVSDVVHDKDGISAALALAACAEEAAAEGSSLPGRLEGLDRRFGPHLTDQVSVELAGERGARQIRAAIERLREQPPSELAGEPMTSVQDLRDADPPSNVLIWTAGERARVVVRPSGTEPKLKVYLQVRLPPSGQGYASDAGLARALVHGREQLERLAGEIRALLGPGDLQATAAGDAGTSATEREPGRLV